MTAEGDEKYFLWASSFRARPGIQQPRFCAVVREMMLSHLTNEHGKSKPVAAVINLFRILDKHPELVEETR